MSATRIVLLNGTPSAGKTTIADALQAQLDQPFWHLSLDDFCAGYRAAQRLSAGLFPRILAGYLLALHDMAATGNDLIAESIITPDNASRYVEPFSEFTVYFIGIRCPLAEAQRREAGRTDRIDHFELDTAEFEAVHAHAGYDLELDSSLVNPQAAARQIAIRLADPAPPRAFGRLAN
jgi:chloramphenicol 3-O phosphotransferase